MRYAAHGTVVYDSYEGEVVENHLTPKAAQEAAHKANQRDQEWREFDSLMRSNRSVCG